jgi:hypothetical protein
MNKLTLIIILSLLTLVNIYSQTNATTEKGKEVILNDDGTWKYSKNKEKVSVPAFIDKTFKWKDGYDKIVRVNFLNLLSGEKKIDKNLFRKMFMNSLTKAKYKLKNRVSFVPRELSLMDSKKGGYVLTVKYLGKNSYGAESENKTMFLYDEIGKYKTSF